MKSTEGGFQSGNLWRNLFKCPKVKQEYSLKCKNMQNMMSPGQTAVLVKLWL